VTLGASFSVAQADARPIFRLAGGGSGGSPLAPLGSVYSAYGNAVAPMPGGGGFVLVNCRYVTRVGRSLVAKPQRIRWAGRRPGCSRERGPRVATPVGKRGDLLVAGPWFRRVVRITSGGRARVVAGPYAGEGEERFWRIGGLAALGDGGFLVSDTDNRRVRRVSADGIVTTVAGNGRAGSSGDGGLAVGASLRRPMGLAVEADGGFLIADAMARRVRRVRPDGTIETVAGNGVKAPAVDGRRATETSLVAPRAVAALSNGAFLIADPGRVRRVGPAGRITTVAGDGGTEWGRAADADGFAWPEGNFFDGIGGSATRASIGPVTWVAVAGDGSYLVRSGIWDSKVYVLPARRSRYFGAAFRRLRPQLGYITYRVNRPSRVTLRLRPRAGGALTVKRRAHPGLNRVRIPARISPDVYHLRLLATTANGHRSADEAGVVIGRRLPNGVPRIAINDKLNRGDYENTSEVGWCDRMTRTRVDCAIVDIAGFECESKEAVRLHAGGQLEAVGYPCGRWRRKVPWHNSSRLPLFGAL
jgi:hypothetical protein